MEENSVDQSRNASPSWSGYIHQGKVGFLVALRELKKCLNMGKSNYKDYKICYENAEDFDIVDSQSKVISRHQVKAYKDGNERERYSTLFRIQTRNIDDGKIVKGGEGFQIHKFDEYGNILKVEVDENSRYLHTIIDVPDFDLSESDYLSKYQVPPHPRTKYTHNESKVQLYEYSLNEKFCPLSVNELDDTIKVYCTTEIKQILTVLGNPLSKKLNHIEQVYFKYIASILDNSVGTAHKDATHPTITFKEIEELITTEIDEDDIYRTKNNLIYMWDEHKKDYEDTLPYETIEIMDNLVETLLQKNAKEFEELIRKLAPHEEKDKPLFLILDGTVLKNILFNLFQEILAFDCDSVTYYDKDNKSYRVSLIAVKNHKAKIYKIIEKIINNTEFLSRSFYNRYLINDCLSGIKIDESINDCPEDSGLTKYKEAWKTGVTDSIFNADMEFIDVDAAINKLKEK